MTEQELQEEIRVLKAKVKALKRRLREKKRYEHGMLIATGATPQYILSIDQKDQAVLDL